MRVAIGSWCVPGASEREAVCVDHAGHRHRAAHLPYRRLLLQEGA